MACHFARVRTGRKGHFPWHNDADRQSYGQEYGMDTRIQTDDCLVMRRRFASRRRNTNASVTVIGKVHDMT